MSKDVNVMLLSDDVLTKITGGSDNNTTTGTPPGSNGNNGNGNGNAYAYGHNPVVIVPPPVI